MHLNNIIPQFNSKFKRKRVGRGIGSGFGKTCGRGHKGQKSRAGGFHKTGFEGGQMPLQRRLPKFGFTSHKAKSTEIKLSILVNFPEAIINMAFLKSKKIVNSNISQVKIVFDKSISQQIQISGINVTARVRDEIINNNGFIS